MIVVRVGTQGADRIDLGRVRDDVELDEVRGKLELERPEAELGRLPKRRLDTVVVLDQRHQCPDLGVDAPLDRVV